MTATERDLDAAIACEVCEDAPADVVVQTCPGGADVEVCADCAVGGLEHGACEW